MKIEHLQNELKQIYIKISEWDKSTFGELMTYYEDAYLKIIEAKLNRQDLLKSREKIIEAIYIYDRVKYLLNERIEALEDKDDLDEDELIVFNKEKDLLEKCSKSLLATHKLKDEIENVFKELATHGIHQRDLRQISLLTSEYKIDLYQVIVDTFGQDEETNEAIMEILNKIDRIFEEYEKWKEINFMVF